MSLKDAHNAILEAIQGKVGEIKDIKSVSIGELTTLSPDKFPACYIILDRDEEADAVDRDARILSNIHDSHFRSPSKARL